MREEKERLIPLLSPVSRGQHTLFYSAQLTGCSSLAPEWIQ